MPLEVSNTDAKSDASIRGALENQLLAGPSYAEVASVLLADALKVLYPTLDLDPHTTVIGKPGWQIVDDEIVALPTFYITLSDMLAAQVGLNESTLLIEGLHFLARLPITKPVIHLPVRISQIGRLMNELAPAMAPATQEQQLAYWNVPFGTYGARWHELSSTLRKFWDVEHVEGWTTTECEMARKLFLHPDPKDRKDLNGTHAYLIDIKEIDGDTVKAVDENSAVVMIGLIENKEVILVHSLLHGYEKFTSRQALGESLPSHLGILGRHEKIRWRLYEPNANVFDSKACAIIAAQVRILGFPDSSQAADATEREQPVSNSLSKDKIAGESWFQKQVPDWLKAASTSELILFAQYMKNLSALSSSQAEKNYLDDIPSIKAYALNALKTKMQAEHADALTLDVETIEIQIQSPVVWGTFVVPGKVDTTRFSLVELALQNLIGLPTGNKSVKSLNASPLPEWLTPDYVERLITTIDLGRAYPDLIKKKLIDDPAESTRREALYTSQLRIQLPMLALESKLREQGNLDEQGYRYVAALMEPKEADRKVDGQTIVLRKLAFVPELQLGLCEDIVANMFIIGPQNPAAGPCLLYRPMLDPQLSQYPSFSNLLYAIRQTPSLRQSVLAWLPDSVRETYSRYVFPSDLPSPWAVVEFAVSPLTLLSYSGPVSLSDEALGADFLPMLFKANAHALVTLADRQSVSNGEARWESFKQAGWLIFNLALPYLGASAGTATWLWQILDDLEKLTQRNEVLSGEAKWEIFVGLLLNVALGIANYAMQRAANTGHRRPTEAPEKMLPPTPSLPKPELVIETLAPLAKTEPSEEHYDTVHTSGALMGRSGDNAGLLATFSIETPKDLGLPQTEGPLKGLYEKDQHWYVQLEGKWFEASVEGDTVSIVKGVRNGPALALDTRGRWHVDPSLRLRGSGSKGARRAAVAHANLRRIELLTTLNRLEEQKPENQKLLTTRSRELNEAAGPSREANRDAYLATLQAQRENYEKALDILIEWPVFQSRPDYPRISLGYINAQINFTFAEIDALEERFTPAIREATGMNTTRARTLEQQHVDTADKMIRVGEDMIERLDYLETRFIRLKELGREGFESVRQHRRKLPVYKSDDLRLMQLDMYRHLCLSLESVSTMPEGWVEINRAVDNATVAFQSLRDAINERSVIRLDEQIDAFGSLTEQFTGIEEHLQYLGNEYKDSAKPQQLARLVKQIGHARTRALRHLAQALDERSNRRTSGSPYEQRPRPRKKFIRARFWGLVSGEPRLSKALEETDWVDVKNPLTGALIVTFHHKETGEWVPHVNLTEPLSVPALATSIEKGKALIDGLPSFNAQLEKDIERPDRTPAGIAMVLSAHASRMEKVSVAIKEALDQAEGTATNETIDLPGPEKRAAQSLSTQLKKASNALYEQEFETVLSLIKQSPPTMSGLIWLKDRNRISITKQINRQRTKDPHHYYLDRYAIKDRKTNKTLWFADFHYSTSWVPGHTFISARLRTVAEVEAGTANLSTRNFNQRQLIAHYRSEIAVDQAKQVFLVKRQP
ncbi:hypothetical protein OC610_06015 [Pseudomonas sp. SAICEU22]|uniref:Dermonecrotic toxin N-terminal domain-containing protein n=1 Tax=Pseudomonas agronomica TaxID=2979328 RepID=A0ABT3F581_9PSED|nr:DUF6543 domain-containing protein [Pseudomonas agronomica]MCW1243954.1 hypothetical protein [Pseudomonas agronomica]